MDEKIKKVLYMISSLAEQNKDFASELQKMFGRTSAGSGVVIVEHVADDVAAIREALEIRANNSISYSFVNDQRTRDQLIIDNLRMENAALDLKQKESERFYTFCINAFYQVENIINYYFYTTYPDINELLSIIEDYTRQEKSEKFQYKRSGKEKNVSDIQIANKIDAYCNIFFNGDKFKMTLGQLRQIRNEGEHRCMIIQQEKDETNSLYKFFKYNTFNSVRIALIKLVNSIKENIGQRLE